MKLYAGWALAVINRWTDMSGDDWRHTIFHSMPALFDRWPNNSGAQLASIALVLSVYMYIHIDNDRIMTV